mmetsp:Transcript_114501/g.328999  ORF Transcript_114501/g.328999 Transcript_114501/m.328999 type:complete len:261 (+) Transcript_114501:1602-2384(+)
MANFRSSTETFALSRLSWRMSCCEDFCKLSAFSRSRSRSARASSACFCTRTIKFFALHSFSCNLAFSLRESSRSRCSSATACASSSALPPRIPWYPPLSPANAANEFDRAGVAIAGIAAAVATTASGPEPPLRKVPLTVALKLRSSALSFLPPPLRSAEAPPVDWPLRTPLPPSPMAPPWPGRPTRCKELSRDRPEGPPIPAPPLTPPAPSRLGMRPDCCDTGRTAHLSLGLSGRAAGSGTTVRGVSASLGVSRLGEPSS